MNPTPTSVPKSSLGLLLTRIVLYLGILAFLWLWVMSNTLLPGPASRWLEWPLNIAIIAVIISAFWPRFRLFRSWRCAVAGAVLLAGVLVWLAWDDAAVAHPLTLAELSPAPAQSAESYQLTLAYTQIDGKAAPGELPAAKFFPQSSPDAKPEAWRTEIVKEREKVAAEWAALAPVREWVGELDRYPAIGDLPEAKYDARIMNTGTWRRLVEFTCAQATLLALDGKGDEASAILRPVLSVALKLERYGRSEVRLFAANRAILRACATAQFVLATTPVSAAERLALATVIAERDVHSVGHRLAWLPYVFACEAMLKAPDDLFASMVTGMGPRQALTETLMSAVRPFVFLPKQTVNLVARIAGRVEQMLLHPKGEGFSAGDADVLREASSSLPKNYGGRVMVAIAIPNYQRIGENLRSAEAARLKLLAGLKP